MISYITSNFFFQCKQTEFDENEFEIKFLLLVSMQNNKKIVTPTLFDEMFWWTANIYVPVFVESFIIIYHSEFPVNLENVFPFTCFIVKCLHTVKVQLDLYLEIIIRTDSFQLLCDLFFLYFQFWKNNMAINVKTLKCVVRGFLMSQSKYCGHLDHCSSRKSKKFAIILSIDSLRIEQRNDN